MFVIALKSGCIVCNHFRTLLLKSYYELKAEMETIQQQMAEAKKSERTVALKKVKELCKEFGFTARMLKGSLCAQ